MNFFKTKPNMLQQDFHRGNNPAYDRVAFVAEHYEELVFMYKDILEHLKQGGTGTGTGGGCTHISKQIESPYGFVQLNKESFKLLGYDLDNPDDIQFLLHNTHVQQSDYGLKFGYYDACWSSKGVEYHDTYEIDLGNKDTFFSRDSGLDNFLDNPSMLQNIDYVTISYYNQDNKQNVTEKFYRHGDSGNNEAFANKESLLQALYLKLSRNCVDAVQNKPITIKLETSNPGHGIEVLYTKASDSVENNPIYVGKTPSKIVTYNNVLLFPILKYTKYAQCAYLIINPITPQVQYDADEAIMVAGTGDIVTIKENGVGKYLSADLPEVLGEHSDTHTFTITIDPDIKADYLIC